MLVGMTEKVFKVRCQ